MSVNKEVIERIRNSFVEQCGQSPDKYCPEDVERVKSDEWSVERFVLSTKSEDAALKALVKAMEWRKTFGVNQLNEDYFPQELYKIGLFSSYCKDKEGRPVIWNTQKAYHKIADFSPLIKQFVVYHYEKADRQTSHQGWAVVNDPTNAGLSNVDMDLSNFTVDILQNYYPLGPKYMLVIDLPWMLNATAKVILAFMGEQLKSIVKFIKKDDIPQYLDLSYVPIHLKGTYDKPMNGVPAGALPLEELPHTKYTSDKIKKFHTTYKQELSDK